MPDTVIVASETPATTETETVTPAQAKAGETPTTPQGISTDTAAQIAAWKERAESGDARNRELNKENAGHRKKAEVAEQAAEAERTATSEYRAFGKPADIKAKLDKLAQMEADEAETAQKKERDEHLSAVAEAAGVDKNVLAGLNLSGITLNVTEKQIGKNTVKEVLVNGKPFDESPEMKPHLPSLRAGQRHQPGIGVPPRPASSAPQIPQQRRSVGAF